MPKFLLSRFFFVLLSCSAGNLLAQDKQTDSLIAVLKSAKEDTAKVNLLIAIAVKFQHKDPAKGMEYATQSLDLAKQLKFDYGTANGYAAVAGFYVEKSDYTKGSEFFNQSKAMLPAQMDNRFKKLNARIQQGLGVIAYYKEDYSGAVKYYLLAADIYKEINDDGSLLVIYNNLSSVHAIMIDKDNALKYAEECYKLSKKINDPFKTSMACVAVASAKIELKSYDGVEAYLSEALKIADSLQNYILLGRGYALLGQFFTEGKSDPGKAIPYLEKSILNLEKSGSQFEVAAAHQRLGEAYSRNGNYTKAAAELNEAIDMSKQLGILQIELHSLKSLTELEEKNNNKAAAFELLKRYNTVKDSIDIQDKQKEVSTLETKYETRIKEYKIGELEKEKKLQDLSIRQKSTFNYILLGSFLTLLIISFLSLRTYRQKQLLQQQQIKQLQNEKLLLATESILKGQEEERSRMAQDLHDGLGGMLSGIKLTLGAMKGNIILSEQSSRLFTKALEQLDSSIGEMRRVAHNMMPEALIKLGLQQALQDYCEGITESKSLAINCQFHGLEKRLNGSAEIIIYRIVQELLNNIVKHANAANVLVQVMNDDGEVDITVEDDGTGFDTTANDLKRGAGLKNIQSRVDYLKGELDIQSVPGKGTSVHINCVV